jgi:AraC-like DNA-binding protein
MVSFPAVSVDALLAGLDACGVDSRRIRHDLGLAPRYVDPAELLPYAVWNDIWAAAKALDPRPELPTLAAQNVPFGMFGALDYLAGSSETIRGGLLSLADYFSAVSAGTELEMDFSAFDAGTVRLINTTACSVENDEFTVAVIIARFSGVGRGRFQPERVYLTRPPLEGRPHERLINAPVLYGASHAGFDISEVMLDIEQQTADPRLHMTLGELSTKMGFRTGLENRFEITVRSRLRSLMPRNQAIAERVAASLGVSERTLHRRLTQLGTSFQEVSDQFRIEESERHLLQGRLQLVEIALALGFADQTSWSRFFRRMRGTSPRAWLTAQAHR